ncbi:hypothetical protein OEZ85_010329 [Tetradesmus obliquus]|uniref:phosphoribosylanthranilate isomerase n=1 Tax=Tetradesmus obliquus TaxID=3088 RepID=A0ABY8TMB5_TETOB|nr:hypothetical protein OEZ85_010329 [Tetradesmus obliquus]
MHCPKQISNANTAHIGSAAIIRPRVRSRTGVCCTASQQQVLVKVCGVTTAEDAQYAAQQGANLIGMIMWPKAKRAVSDDTAAAIAAAAKQHGAQAVGVFVDEDAATISRRCRAAGIPIAQLHGDASRAAVNQVPADLQVVYVLQANDAGQIVTPLPGAGAGQQLQRSIEWLLVDGMTGGSGKSFDWSNLQVPAGLASKGWLLAGGLNPGNVSQAVATAHPTAVDVSSGVCGPDGLAKDHSKVAAFIAGAKQAAAAAQ